MKNNVICESYIIYSYKIDRDNYNNISYKLFNLDKLEYNIDKNLSRVR